MDSLGENPELLLNRKNYFPDCPFISTPGPLGTVPYRRCAMCVSSTWILYGSVERMMITENTTSESRLWVV